MEDEERADDLIEALEVEDEDAAFTLELTLFPDRVFGYLFEDIY